MKRFCLTLDLKDNPELIAAYEEHHRNVWKEITESIINSGILNMEIYRTGNRLCMIIETKDDFSFEEKALMDSKNPKVQEWETLMLKFQQPLIKDKPNEKWLVMDKIFDLF